MSLDSEQEHRLLMLRYLVSKQKISACLVWSDDHRDTKPVSNFFLLTKFMSFRNFFDISDGNVSNCPGTVSKRTFWILRDIFPQRYLVSKQKISACLVWSDDHRDTKPVSNFFLLTKFMSFRNFFDISDGNVSNCPGTVSKRTFWILREKLKLMISW